MHYLGLSPSKAEQSCCGTQKYVPFMGSLSYPGYCGNNVFLTDKKNKYPKQKKLYIFLVNTRSEERRRVIESSLRVPLTKFFFIYKFGTHTEDNGSHTHNMCVPNFDHQYAENTGCKIN